MNEFRAYHPVVNFTYFAAVIAFSCYLMHPVALGISFAISAAYAVMTGGRRAVRFILLYIIPLMAATAVINPLFNHRGVTILTYFPGGNPLTLESIIYGVAAAVMMASVVCFFASYNRIMSSDKFIYLFGRIIPSLSLIFSMVLQFVPRFKRQLAQVSAGQQCLGRDSTGSMVRRARAGIRLLSVMVTWSLENAVETADSMKSRGYGLPGRTAYSNFKFSKKDGVALATIIVLGTYVLAGLAGKGMQWQYYPSVTMGEATPFAVSVLAAYAALCAVPVIIELWEGWKWKSSRRRA